MTQEYFANYKGYLKDKRRVAAFGRQIGDKLEVFLLFCAKNDEFSKQYAKNIYERYRNNLAYGGCHPQIFLLPIKEGDSAVYTFNQQCKKAFYFKKEQSKTYRETLLVKENEKPIILKARRSYKLDKTY